MEATSNRSGEAGDDCVAGETADCDWAQRCDETMMSGSKKASAVLNHFVGKVVITIVTTATGEQRFRNCFRNLRHRIFPWNTV